MFCCVTGHFGRLPRYFTRCIIFIAVLLFAIEDWNFYDEIVGREIPRTNNSVEGFHRGFTDRFTGAHPPMMKFVNALKQQQRATDFTVNRMDYDINDLNNDLNKRNKLCVLDTARHSKIQQRDVGELSHLKSGRVVNLVKSPIKQPCQ